MLQSPGGLVVTGRDLLPGGPGEGQRNRDAPDWAAGSDSDRGIALAHDACAHPVHDACAQLVHGADRRPV